MVWTSAALAAPITGVRASVSDAKIRIVLDSSAPFVYKDSVNNNILNIVLSGSTVKTVVPAIKDNHIQDIRLDQLTKDSARLSIKVGKSCKYKIFSLSNPHRLVIDVFKFVTIRRDTKLDEGVVYSYRQEEWDGSQIQAHVIHVFPGASFELKGISAAGKYQGRGSLLQQARLRGALVAINTSYFDTQDNWIVGSTKLDGRIISGERLPRTAFTLTKGLPKILKDCRYTGTARLANGKLIQVDGINRGRIANDLVVYNEFYGPSTRTNQYGLEVKVDRNFSKILAVSNKGNMSIEPGTVVLSAHGNKQSLLAGCWVGGQIYFSETLGSKELDTADMVVGAGPMLLEQGQVRVRAKEENIPADIANGRAPRTAIGVRKDGTILLAVVDGRSVTSSGMTLTQLARYLQKFGAVEAVNMDGGGSSELIIKGTLRNNPSDGRERRVSMGLGLFKKS